MKIEKIANRILFVLKVITLCSMCLSAISLALAMFAKDQASFVFGSVAILVYGIGPLAFYSLSLWLLTGQVKQPTE